MQSSSRRRSIRALVLTALGAVVVTMTAIAGQSFAADQAGAPSQFVVPPGFEANPPGAPAGSSPIDPPARSRPLGAFSVQTGTQNYTCANGTFGGPATPEATLTGDPGVIHHLGGPSWQLLSDGSTVKAAKLADQAVGGAVPELLLGITEHSGAGLLTQATHIQRLATRGGVAPSRACSDGETASVPYSALYVFWAAS